MKTLKSILGALCIAFSIALIPITVSTSGCKTSQQKQTINTLFTVGSTVDVTLKGYLDLVLKEQVSTNGVPKVLTYYAKFQEAFKAAVVAVSGNSNAVPPQAVFDAAAAFTIEVEAAKKGQP